MIILASKSPRRIEMINKWNTPFKVMPSDINEDLYPIDQISYQKAIKIASINPLDTVISADTVVILDDEILGKPKDEEDAVRMLTVLSGRTHEVFTGVCIVYPQTSGQSKELLAAACTKVVFKKLTMRQIKDYVATGSPMDKAGAYGIQDGGLVQRIDGSFSNVVGWPIELCKELINTLV